MVFKVLGDIDNTNVGTYLYQLSSQFKGCYLNNTLYLAITDYSKHSIISLEPYSIKDSQTVSKELLDILRHQIFVPTESFLVTEITLDNVNREADFAKQWCMEQMTRLDKERFEVEKQNELQKIMNKFDELEVVWERRLEEKKTEEKKEKEG